MYVIAFEEGLVLACIIVILQWLAYLVLKRYCT